MSKNILIVFDDPGGGLAVSSLLEYLKRDTRLNLKILWGKLSEDFVRAYEYEILNSEIEETEVEKTMNNFFPDLLLTGTGAGKKEQLFRNAAMKKNIKSVVILDFWKDYKRRWLYSEYDIGTMTDKICVMDELTKEEMIADGFSENNLIVTKHPYLDKIFNSDKPVFSKSKSVNNHFLFLSQPLQTIGVKEYKIHPVKILFEALNDFDFERNKKIFLKIKLHPLEKKSAELNSLVSKYNSESLHSYQGTYNSDGSFELPALDINKKLNIKYANEYENLRELIEQAEVVIGYNSIALFEARALNKRTISLNVAETKDSLKKAMASAGIEIVNADKKKIIKTLFKKYNDSNDWSYFKGGTENCVKVIYDELGINQMNQ